MLRTVPWRGILALLAILPTACAISAPPVAPGPSAGIPDSPVGAQLRWALHQLDGGAATLDEAELRRHVDDDLLTHVFGPAELIDVMRETAATMGPFQLEGFAFAPTETTAVALVRGSRPGPEGDEAALFLQVAPDGDQKIVDLNLGDRPQPAAGQPPYEGLHDVGGRRIYLSCSGSEGPTVVLDGGSTLDWGPIQTEVSGFARVCSYDKPNAQFGRSDPVSGPRTASDAVADLAAVLDAADVPGPFVLVGHSRGGAFVQLFALQHPDDIAGVVLLDAQHFDLWERTTAVAKEFYDDEGYAEWFEMFAAPPPPAVDPLQFDDRRSLTELRAAHNAASFPQVPLVVVTHELYDPAGPPGWAEVFDAMYRDLQSELAELVPGSPLVIAEGSGHDIPADRPAVVVDAIRDVVDAARS